LVTIAARVVGNRAEAEDIVQDVWVRWQTCDRGTVVNPTAFLVAATTRMAINVTRSARARHESCARRSVPEPADARADPTTGPEQRDSLRVGLTLVVERLTPAERGAYVLRHAFDYSYAEIARLLRTTEANARQLVSRAGKRMSTAGCRHAPTAEPERLLGAFVSAAAHGDVTGLEAMFAAAGADRDGAQQRPSATACWRGVR
jgi:RNA polymerase sigma-70 factor (ECF subfamily)